MFYLRFIINNEGGNLIYKSKKPGGAAVITQNKMNASISLKELSERIQGGKYWERGDLKRIYLDRGYNTKKMSTKTFIWQNESGKILVSCKVECPSQPYQWCISQQDEVIAGVQEELEEALAEEVFHFVNFTTEKPIDIYGKETPLNHLFKNIDFFYSENAATAAHKDASLGSTVLLSKVSRNEFEKEVEKLNALEPEVSPVVTNEVIVPKKNSISKKLNTELNFTEGDKVNHATFGDGEVLNFDGEIIEVKFKEETKKFVLKYVKLEKI